MTQNFDPLSPQELRLLVESNARSIQAVAGEIRETNRSIAWLKPQTLISCGLRT